MSLFLQALSGKLYQLQVILLPVDGILFCAMLDMVTCYHFHSCLVLYHPCRNWQYISSKNTLVITYQTLCIFSILMINLLMVQVFLAETCCQFWYEWYNNKQMCKWKPVSVYNCQQYLSRFWTFAILWMLYSFFWVILWCLYFIRQQSVPKHQHIQFKHQGSPKRKNTLFVYFASVCRPMKLLLKWQLCELQWQRKDSYRESWKVRLQHISVLVNFFQYPLIHARNS